MGSNNNGLPVGNASMKFTDDETQRSVNLYLIIDSDGLSPLLATDQGLVVKKDIAAGGMLTSNQGILALGNGLNSMDEPAKIILMHSNGFGTKDTLYLTQFGGSVPAHLDLGNLTAHGNILVEKDTPQIRLNSISATNGPSIIFYDNSVIKISQGYDVENDLLYFYDHTNNRTAMSLTHNNDRKCF